ncbi:IS5 family transposase [Streptomyces malaysiensis subsp. malaysiensis]|nr:IS5 family transposase [Streptomyces malaysiensis]
MLDKIPAVVGVVGRPRHRPDALLSDRGYDHDKYRRLL